MPKQHEPEINFFNESVSFSLKDKKKLRSWILEAAEKMKREVGILNYIFCSDSYLRKMNREYLDHDYFTDIITFPMMEEGDKILNADIFISIDRVRENAKDFRTGVTDEVRRVMIHGLLHLCGYDDHSSPAREKMRKAEDRFLADFPE